jgi:formylglycine-generating enzyme required for sulfatase activity
MSDRLDSAFDFYFAKPTNTLMPEQANFRLGEKALNRTCQVGSYKPNRLGLYDMHGNVWEWCHDEFPGDPKDPKAASQRATRGGSWGAGDSDSGHSRAADHNTYATSFRVNDFGMRLARVPSGASSPEVKTPPLAVAPFDAAQAKKHQEAWAKHLGVPVEVTNSIGMKFRLIPPGEFTMGSTAAEIEAARGTIGEDSHWQVYIQSEAPQHKVILKRPIYLGVNEVTQAEYEIVIGANPSHFARTGMGREAVAGMETANHPVEMVSWNDAAEFCVRLSQQEKFKPVYFRVGETIRLLDGNGYRLPSEAEWEFACRAGTATKYWAGDNDEDLARAGWFGANSGDRTHAAGELKANPFGLSDVHGNVWEWVQDGWDATSYGQFLEKFATDPNSPFSTSPMRVIRGGHCGDYASSFCRSSSRHAGNPLDRFHYVGFRVSLSVEAVKAAKQQPPAPVAKLEPPLAIAPFTDADVARIAALPAAEQVEEVRKELMRRNPGFDGKVEHKIEDGVVTEFRIVTDQVTDIAPIRVFNALRVLVSSGTYTEKPNGLLADLTSLSGMNLAGLIYLDLANTTVTDAGLIPFKDCKSLTHVDLPGTRVSDAGLTHFKDCKALTFLNLEGTQVGDAGLAHFKGMPLMSLWIDDTGITDLTPLQGMPLEDIRLTPKNITQGLNILRDMKSLKTIGKHWDQAWPAAEFWERYDKGEFKE